MSDIGWKPNPRNPWEARWAEDDRRDLKTRGERFGPKPAWKRFHYPAPEFLAEVSAMYRQNTERSVRDAELAERRGYVDLPLKTPAIGNFAAAILAKAKPTTGRVAQGARTGSTQQESEKCA